MTHRRRLTEDAGTARCVTPAIHCGIREDHDTMSEEIS